MNQQQRKNLEQVISNPPPDEWPPSLRVETTDNTKKRYLFGESEARYEWKKGRAADDVFLHTPSYRQFQDYRVLAMYGRRGSGKSSMLNMLHHQTRNPESASINYTRSEYKYSWLIQNDEDFADLVMQFRGDVLEACTDAEIRLFAGRVWRWIIKVSAMQAVLWTRVHEEGCANLEDFKKVTKYLAQRGLCNEYCRPTSKTAIESAAETVRINYCAGKTVGLLVRDIIDGLNDEAFRQATALATRFMIEDNGTCVVMLDSIEEYPFDDRLWRLTLLGLFDAVKQIYEGTEGTHTVAKVAVPSELRAHVRPVAPSKFEDHELFIFWTYRDLVTMVAKRLSKSLGAKDRWYSTDTSDSQKYKAAIEYLYSILPRTVTNRQGHSSDTLAYIIRHTQKRPRQLVKVMNCIFDSSAAFRESPRASAPKVTAEEIIFGVHAISNSQESDALNNYENIYQGAPRMAKLTLARQPNVFKWGRVVKMMRDIKHLRKGYSTHEIQRMLIEAGIVGRVTEIHEKEDCFYLDVEYEYQVKRTLEIKSKDFVAVHPMFYEPYGSLIHPKVIPYPRPSDSEERALVAQRGLEHDA